MSSPLLARSPDLRSLVDDGYEVEIRSGYLLMHHVPYVDADQQVRYGTLVSDLSLAGDVTAVPGNHVARFIGAEPCDQHCRPLDQLINDRNTQVLADGVEVNFSFSQKPVTGTYADYHEKMTTYAAMLSAPARVLEPAATAATFAPVPTDQDDSVFCYLDTASARAGISVHTRKLDVPAVAIVGLGGTGSYILDLLAKTPVRQIHLFDGDRMYTHNAFRMPGAASLQQLQATPSKVAYLAQSYGNMHRGIVPHETYIDETNVEQLRGVDFVFIAVDHADTRALLADRLEQYGIAFIDAGLGVIDTGDRLTGMVRVTTSLPGSRSHVHERHRLPYGDADGEDPYARNIQIAELNALNANLAVIKWKKHCGFYADLESETFTVYQIDGNELLNEDKA